MVKTTKKETEETSQGLQFNLSPDLWANEYICEVRCAPNARLLDNRGRWAEMLSRHTGLPEWNIVENRFDVFSTDQKTRLFVSYKSFGMILNDCPSAEHFLSLSDKFLQWLFRQPDFGSTLRINRIGVRIRFGTSFNGTFDELRDRISSRYFRLPENAQRAIGEGASLVDIGAVLNWKDEIGLFNTNLGPMTSKELKANFERGDENPPPEVGLYYDIDYFRVPKRELLGVETISSVRKFVFAASERYQRIRDLIFMDK